MLRPMSEPPVTIGNLRELLDSAAKRWPEKPALIEGTEVQTFRDLRNHVLAASEHLSGLSLRRGSRIGLCYPNSIAYVVLTFALWEVDAVVVPIPIECTPEEVKTLARTMQLEGILRHQPEAEGEILPGCTFSKLESSAPPDNHGLNIAFIRFTSGTTSARKGVVLTHETVYRRLLTANEAFRIGPGDTVMWCLPMSHHFLITILLYLSQGATTVLNKFLLATTFLEEAERYRATVLYATPFHYSLLAGTAPGPMLPGLRLAVSTTCALSREVAQGFKNRFGKPLLQALGIIELGLVSLNAADPDQRWDSVGRPLGAHQVRITDADESGCGEVCIRGPGFLDAYAAPWLPQEIVLEKGGWFRTGDVGRFDQDGFLFLVGRTTAVISLAGRKVFPEEIESVLNQHPAVRESRVYGRAHTHLGEVIEAEVVLAQPGTNPETLRDFCRKHLAAYKVPTRLELVNELPRTEVTGKIRRACALA